MATKRQQEMRRQLRGMAPLIPFADAEAVLAAASGGSLRHLTPAASVWLALTARVRHVYTDYDALLQNGYDRDAARHFVVEAMEAQLMEWGCARPMICAEDQ